MSIAANRLALVLFPLLSVGCKEDVDAIIKGAGWVEAGTSGSLAMDLSTVVYSNQYGLNTGEFTEDGLARHDEVALNLYDNSVGETYCGTDSDACADGDISTITVVFDGVETEIDYPTYTVPPPLEEADAFVDDLMESLETCISSLELTVGDACVKITVD